MKTILPIIPLFLLLFISGTAMAQKPLPSQTIRGNITDKDSGAPVSFATILLSERPGTGAITDSLGEFRIEKIPVGRYSLQVSCIGYETVILKEILLSSAKEVYLDIPLSQNIRELDELVVKPTLNKEAPLNKMALTGARMLSVEEASRYAGGFDDPARLVGSFAGVSPSVSTNGISVHGNAPYLLQWKLEDVEIPNPNHFADISVLGGGVLSSLSSHVVGNSDFFSGAFPAEYNNAVSGVFDIKLRNGNNNRFEHTFQAGIMGIDFASEGPLSKKKKSSYLFNYRYSTTGLLSHISPGTDLSGTLDYQDLNFKFNFPTRKAGTFSVWGTGLADKFSNDTEEDPAKWEYNSDRELNIAKQYMGAAGVSHRYFTGHKGQFRTTLATTYSNDKADQDVFNEKIETTPFLQLDRKLTNVNFTSSYTHNFNPRFTNKTGVNYTQMYYNMALQLAPYEGQPLFMLSEGKGNTGLVSVYNSSSIGLSDKVTANIGMNGQYLLLNHHYTVEPRAALKWQSGPATSFAIAYGLHSRMEKTDIYFVRTEATGEQLVNKDLGFTRSHHLQLSFTYKLSENMSLRIEPYFQKLFDIPVEVGSSYSIINRTELYMDRILTNKGKGRNMGIDITLEKYMSKGYYYMLNGSIFDSRYRGEDGNWYNTRYNRRFIANALGGKEWMLGKNRQNRLSVNLKFTLQGGDRYSPVDEEATLNHPAKEIQYDETRAYSQQFSPMFITNATVSYKINKKSISHEFSVKALNLTGQKEYYGHEYNHFTGTIDAGRKSTSLTNVSYKLEF